MALFVSKPRAAAAWRADRTRAATATLDSAPAPSNRSSTDGRCTPTRKVEAVEQRSRHTAEIASAHRRVARAAARLAPSPQGQGFMAATSRKRAGNSTLARARLTRTTPSSSGWRSPSSTVAGNSASSRVAVNTGEALVSVDARADEGLVAGDVINTAARLQSAAPVNGILVGEKTYRATEGSIEYRERGPVDAKGKQEPVVVWEAVSARSLFGVDVDLEPSTRLVGRRRELDQLLDALARARAEHEPQLVTIVGVPGMGKSRLVQELSTRIEADPELIRWRQGRSLPYGEGVSYWALGEMIKAEAGILESDEAPVAESKLRETVARICSEGEIEWLRTMLNPLVGIADDASGGDRRGEAFAAWRRFVEGLAAERATVLVFEDLHWADDGLLDFVDSLVDWATDVPLLIVATARPELLTRRPHWGGGKTNAATLSLAPLSETETAELVHAILERSVLPADVQSAVLARAGGNPLYAEEFARMVAERGDLHEGGEPRSSRFGSRSHLGTPRLADPRRKGTAAGRRRGRQGVLAGRAERRPRRSCVRGCPPRARAQGVRAA